MTELIKQTGNGIRRLTVPIKGKAHGWAEDNETDDQAIARIVCEAEQRVNENGDVRLHLEVSKTYEPHL